MSDYNIDRLSEKDGVLSTMPGLSLDLDDRYIIQSLHANIQKSQDFYDDTNRYNLTNKRLKNEQIATGRHLADHKLYRHQTPYIDNEVFVGSDAIIAYVTAQTPRAEVYPASDKQESKILAKHLENYLHAHSEKFKLPRKLEGVVYNGIYKYVGFFKLRWDPNYGANGEIVPEVVDPNHIIIDHTAKTDENPRFICHVLKDTIEGLIARFPDKEEEILSLFSIKRRGTRNMSAEIAYREVWFTYYDKDYKPQEAVCWYVQDLVLDKRKNPNWLYEGEGKNFLDTPMKPFIPFNVQVDGSNWIDKTSAVEQAISQQDILNKLGRQIIDNLATANGFKVIDSHAMTKDDAQNFTGDPNQILLVKTKPGQGVNEVVAQLNPQMVSAQLIEEKQAAAQNIHNILGTPSQFRGDDSDQTKTATEGMMIKNQASGRQDKIVRSVDYMMDTYFKLLSQMICVWYDEKHYATINGGDGNFDFIEMHRNKIEAGMSVRVQSGTTLPFDKARQEAVAQNAADLGLLSPIDYYTLMHMENPQKLFDNMVKWKTSPQELAMDIASNDSDAQAVIDYTELMGGRSPKDREDPTPEYIEQLRKLMISDEFLNAKKSLQNKVIKFVEKAVESLALRTELDQASNQMEVPMPQPVQATIPPPMMQPGMAPMPGAMGMGQSPMGLPPAGPMPGVTPPPGMPQAGQPMQPPMPPQQMPSMSPIASIMQAQPQPGGAPNLNPSQPTVNMGNVSQLPPV